jgi:hypothetical protein
MISRGKPKKLGEKSVALSFRLSRISHEITRRPGWDASV